ncbi:thermonuclease family protein [Thiohalorhabdus methylotrophus]|uniref:Thermonuclease family protein n=1 Tax=Thiohalorhabdus methylotrophus TaxID=3242694 RepID=A0ABV4TRR6_9GAMM
MVLGLLPPAASAAAAEGTAYRWVDDRGTVHYGDRPPPGAEPIGRARKSGGGEWRAVEWIPDGDTIHLADGTKVRLIGINTPEVAHRDDPAEPGGPEAQRFLRRFLAEKKVRLELGPEKKDKYDRTLAHVHTAGGANVNALLLRRGHAHAVVKPPNLSRLERYFAAEREARRAGRGIWSRPRYGVQPAARARDLRNAFHRIRGRVARVETARKYIYLHFAEDFVAILRKDSRDAFTGAGKAPANMERRIMVVRGWIHLHDGTPSIRLRHPVQIESVR